MTPSEAKHKRRDACWPIVLAVTITLCSGYPAVNVDTGWFQIDKLAHFCLYGALATALVRNAGLKRWPLLGCWWAILLASAYGIGDEFRQSLTTVRLFEWDDWLADSLGAATAVLLYLRWAEYRRLLETPLQRKKPQVESSAVLPPTLVA